MEIKIIFCTTLTLVLVFAPKVLEVIRTPVGGDQQRYRKGMMKSMTGSKASSCSEMKVSRQLSTYAAETPWLPNNKFRL